MKKTYRYLMLALAGTAILSGCGKKDDDKHADETEASVSTEAADVTDTETETETETESRTLQPITPSDYLVKNASDYVTLGSYDGIEIVQYTYDITDEMVQEQIDAARQDAATEEEKSGPSTTGDIVYVTLKSSVKDVADSEESEDTYFTIGDADYGEDFDAALTGVSTGDEKTFSIDFDDDFWIDTWAGHTVNFDATVTQVTQLLVPDYDDDFLATYTDYTTKEDYEASIRSSLEDEHRQATPMRSPSCSRLPRPLLPSTAIHRSSTIPARRMFSPLIRSSPEMTTRASTIYSMHLASPMRTSTARHSMRSTTAC